MASRVWAVNSNGALPVAQIGLYYSDNNGATWTQDATKTLPGGAASYVPGTLNSFRLQTATQWVITKGSNPPTFYVSNDAGVTWSATSTMPNAAIDVWLDNDVQILNDGFNLRVSTDNFATYATITSAGQFNSYTIRTITRNLKTSQWIAVARSNAPSIDVYTAGASGLVWTRRITPITDASDDINTSNRNIGWNTNGAYFIYLTNVAGHFGVTILNDAGSSSKTLDAVGSPTVAGVLISAYNANNRLSATDMWIGPSNSPGTAYESVTGQSSWIGVTGVTNTVPPIVRLDDGSYIDTKSWRRSTNNGVSWTATTWPNVAPINDQMISYAPHDFIPAPSVERPHFIDRGLPIEIAGPRNDITRKAYNPIVRIYGA